VCWCCPLTVTKTTRSCGCGCAAGPVQGAWSSCRRRGPAVAPPYYSHRLRSPAQPRALPRHAERPWARARIWRLRPTETAASCCAPTMHVSAESPAYLACARPRPQLLPWQRARSLRYDLLLHCRRCCFARCGARRACANPPCRLERRGALVPAPAAPLPRCRRRSCVPAGAPAPPPSLQQLNARIGGRSTSIRPRRRTGPLRALPATPSPLAAALAPRKPPGPGARFSAVAPRFSAGRAGRARTDCRPDPCPHPLQPPPPLACCLSCPPYYQHLYRPYASRLIHTALARPPWRAAVTNDTWTPPVLQKRRGGRPPARRPLYYPIHFQGKGCRAPARSAQPLAPRRPALGKLRHCMLMWASLSPDAARARPALPPPL
jgi:hypothetical protein